MTVLLVGWASVAGPLPSDGRVVPPTGVSQQIATFSGKWQGIWDDTLDPSLVVEGIKGNEAVVIYAVGDSAAWQISRGFSHGMTPAPKGVGS